MILKSVMLKNFRPFLGSNVVNLEPAGGSNLIVIFGENMRGKTAILNGIRWGLYQQALSRLGQPVPIYRDQEKGGEQLLNSIADSQGDFSLAVHLNFEHGGRDYMLRREATASSRPESDDDFEIRPYLQIDGNAVASADIESEVANILHRDISRFSLFDGEMLTEYEKLLAETGQGMEAVKDAIEKILGLPALTRARTHLAAVAEDDEDRVNKAIRAKDKNDRDIEELEKLSESVLALKRDRGRLDELLKETVEQCSVVEAELKESEKFNSVITNISVLESQIDSANEAVGRERNAIRAAMSTTWWVPILTRLKQKRVEVQGRIDQEIASLQAEFEREHLSTTLDLGKCALCERELDEQAQACVHSKLSSADAGSRPSSDAAYVARLSETLKFLGQLGGEREAERVVLAEASIMEHEVDVADKEAQVDDLRRTLGNRSKGDNQSRRAKFLNLTAEVTRLEGKLRDLDSDIAEEDAKRARQQAKVNRFPGVDRSVRIRAEVSRLCSEAFTQAIDRFREEARNKVSKEADSIFSRLTTEADYSGLQINENFGLDILDSKGRKLAGRSAGAEQIVALSLIGGLNRCSVGGDSPIVMDTNFGRLDRGHRENVLRFVSDLDQQVVLLVHSGELDETDLRDFKIEYSRKYRIERISDSHSEVMPA